MPMIGPEDGRRVMSPGAGLDFRIVHRRSLCITYSIRLFLYLWPEFFANRCESLGVRTLLSIAIFDTRRIPNYTPLRVSVPIQ